MRLKVCGMKFPENIREVAQLQPDYLGFIFHKASSRYFDGAIPPVSKEIRTTGVFVNASIAQLLEKVEKHGLRAVQLHGDEPPEYCLQLRKKLSEKPGNEAVALLKVFSVDDAFDLKVLEPFEGKVDHFLFDTRGQLRGGNGIPFNWNLLLEYPSSTPFFLSGGIGLEEVDNIKLFIAQLQQRGKAHLLQGLDVNSRFESAPGMKNINELKVFRKELEVYLNKNTSNELPR